MKKTNFIGRKVMLEKPTATTKCKMYRILGTRYDNLRFREFSIRNENGRVIYLLQSRFNTNSWFN